MSFYNLVSSFNGAKGTREAGGEGGKGRKWFEGKRQVAREKVKDPHDPSISLSFIVTMGKIDSFNRQSEGKRILR